MIKDRGILFRGYETGHKQNFTVECPNDPLVKSSKEEREAAKQCGWPKSQII
jgi:hypothetical protein